MPRAGNEIIDNIRPSVMRPERRGREQDQNEEILHTLDGTRNRFRNRAAVRIEDLTGILQLLPKLQSVPVGAAPTQAQFNTLLSDVRKIHTQLSIVAAALQRRLTV